MLWGVTLLCIDEFSHLYTQGKERIIATGGPGTGSHKLHQPAKLERGDLMGDTKSKKDKAKGKKQDVAKHVKDDQRKKDKQKTKAI